MKEFVEKLNKRLKKELCLADEEKRRCASENPLQFDSSKGYANGIAIAIDIVNQVSESYSTSNAERIRSMSDEEMALHYSELMREAQEYEYCTDVKDWLEWLQSKSNI